MRQHVPFCWRYSVIIICVRVVWTKGKKIESIRRRFSIEKALPSIDGIHSLKFDIIRMCAYALTLPFANILSRYDYNRIYLYFVHDIDGFIWLMYSTWLENRVLSSSVFLSNLLHDGIDNRNACVRIFPSEWMRDARFCKISLFSHLFIIYARCARIYFFLSSKYKYVFFPEEHLLCYRLLLPIIIGARHVPSQHNNFVSLYVQAQFDGNQQFQCRQKASKWDTYFCPRRDSCNRQWTITMQSFIFRVAFCTISRLIAQRREQSTYTNVNQSNK